MGGGREVERLSMLDPAAQGFQTPDVQHAGGERRLLARRGTD